MDSKFKCELCGFVPKTTNKYREKTDHLIFKHFKEKINIIYPQDRAFKCTVDNCNQSGAHVCRYGKCHFHGKDRQAYLR